MTASQSTILCCLCFERRVFSMTTVLAALLVLRAAQLSHSLGDLVSTVPSIQPHCDCVPLAWLWYCKGLGSPMLRTSYCFPSPESLPMTVIYLLILSSYHCLCSSVFLLLEEQAWPSEVSGRWRGWRESPICSKVDICWWWDIIRLFRLIHIDSE